MPLMVKETGNGRDYEPIPEGTFEAVCYAVIDLGTHYSDAFKKDAHKVLVQWEVPDCRIQIERDGKTLDLPRAISKRYTMSLHKKAALRHDLEAWRGKAFTPEELAGFDLAMIAGKACLLGIIHETGNDGKTYARVSSIMAMPRRKGAAPLTAENPVVTFDIPEDSGPGFAIPLTLPDWIRETIEASKEYAGTLRAKPAVEMPREAVTDGTDRAGDDETLPF